MASETGRYLARFDLLTVVVSTDSTVVTSGSTFAYSSNNGDIERKTHQGFYAYDTRFLSEFTVLLDGRRLVRTGSATFDDKLASFYCASKGISVVRDRYVAEVLHEDVALINYTPAMRTVRLEFCFEADFADIFEVRRGRIKKLGRVEIEPREGQTLALVYRRGGFSRETWISFAEQQPVVQGKRVMFDITLQPKQAWKTCIEMRPVVTGTDLAPECASAIPGSPFEQYEPGKAFLGFFREINAGSPLEAVPQMNTDNADLCQAYYRAVADLRALRLDQGGGNYILAAGLPWFMTIFGRDAIISSLQTKILGAELMKGTVHTLARLQATEFDAFREAEPGKILHEARRGELSLFENVPHSRYYGSVDSTPLFMILLWEAYRWTGDVSILEQFLPAAEKALAWIDRFGDLDGDGFVEYQRRTPKGLRNQGWKDSRDSVSFMDGSLARGPIALCEVQGYVYEAKRKMAEIYRVLGKPDLAAKLSREADKLKRDFNQAFWMPDAGFYALALDGRKQPVNAITSNPGHCLWSGIVNEDKAAKVAARLMAPDMFTGWGVRTLSSEMVRYDPLSYHNGSIWPHDNSIIAAGLARYGFVSEADAIALALLDAAAVFRAYQLPELFAGYPRRQYSFPVPYPAANAPQAWASGALIYLMETMLGVTPTDGGLTSRVVDGKRPPFSLSGIPYRGQKWDLPQPVPDRSPAPAYEAV